MIFANLLDHDAISLQMEASSAREVIETLGDLLYQKGVVLDGFVQATLEREATMPTGLPLSGSVNAAIPHVDIEYVKESALALATLKEPVIFHNMVETTEEVPVQLVIMLALSEPKSQIEMLKRIAEVLQNADTVEQILAASNPADVLRILDDVGT